MRDMFYNYDNNIDKKSYDQPVIYEQPEKVLVSDTVVRMVYDVNGDQIGVQAKYKDDFYLYFNMEGTVEDSSIAELVSNSTISFQIVDFFHQIIIDKVLDSSCYCPETDTIIVHITKSEAAQLKQESYRMNLTLTWPDGSYELFAEKDAMLIIR